MRQDHTNTPPSDVYLDGVKLDYVLWADIERRKVCVAIQPLRPHRHGKRVLSKVLRGAVEIIQKGATTC